ncbi:MAG: GDSL-type esterase/lipase family protein [Candidatus Coproplasma sp.]
MKECNQITLYVVGDSTVAEFKDDYYLPRCGYGVKLGNYLVPEVKVVNLALSGRSSLSFLKEENYKILLSSVKRGDYVSIGFGHNDEKGEDARYTNANLSKDERGEERGISFRRNLWENYILPALERGATPILCTPIARLSEEGDYSGSCGHITATTGKYEGGNYPAAVRELGKETGVAVIDLTAATVAQYQKIGFDGASNYHGWASTSNGLRSGLDQTHLNAYGAKYVAYEWARLLSLSDCPLKEYLRSEPLPPDISDLQSAVNRDYKEPEYAPFNAQTDASKLYNLTPPWYGTVMGDFGGNEHIKEFVILQKDGGYTVGNDSTVVRGKISKSTDGFAAAFTPVPSGKNFVVTAKATVICANQSDNQSAFGLMARDNIYVDDYRSAENANFVAAGYCAGNAIFFREGGKLSLAGGEKTGSGDGKTGLGGEYALSITKINQQIVVECNGVKKSFFDFDLTAVDNKSVYICLFANRGLTVSFTDVCVTLTGDSVQA